MCGPAYQGLIAQLDDHLGRLFDFMDRQGLSRDTLVIFCADHGDFLGDHWLGEKELFYDTVQRVPFIVADPRAAADATRGTVDDRFVECVDVVPTVLETLGVPIPGHRVEGRSLLPLLRGEHAGLARLRLQRAGLRLQGRTAHAGPHAAGARAFSIRTATHRYVNWLDLPEQLFDLQADPSEIAGPGRDAGSAALRVADARPPARLPGPAQAPHLGQRRVRRQPHRHAQEGRRLLRAVVSPGARCRATEPQAD
jgi:arylsulfatase A-like enzyme